MAFDHAIDEYLDDKSAFRIEPQQSADRLTHSFMPRIARQPGTDIGLLIGDCLHNLRCSLDHTVWHLADPVQRGNHTEFPVFVNQGLFYEVHSKGPDKGLPTPRSGLYKIKGVEAAVRTIIEEAQPFKPGNEGDRGALATLHNLERFDKHRVLQTVVTVIRQVTQEFPNLRPGESVVVRFSMGVMKDDTPIATYILPRAEAAMNMKVKFEYGVATEDPMHPGEWLDPTVILPGLRTAIRNLIDRLTPFIHE